VFFPTPDSDTTAEAEIRFSDPFSSESSRIVFDCFHRIRQLAGSSAKRIRHRVELRGINFQLREHTVAQAAERCYLKR
jgi:hypothetical protein